MNLLLILTKKYLFLYILSLFSFKIDIISPFFSLFLYKRINNIIYITKEHTILCILFLAIYILIYFLFFLYLPIIIPITIIISGIPNVIVTTILFSSCVGKYVEFAISFLIVKWFPLSPR